MRSSLEAAPALRRPNRLLCALALASLIRVAAAQDSGPPVPAAVADRLAQLEAQLAAQEAHLAQLQDQVADWSTQDVQAARVDVLRQQIREVLADEEFRTELSDSMLQAGYDEGFYIRSSDDRFRINFNGFLQVRFTHYGTRSENRDTLPGLKRHDRTGFDLTRTRAILSGNAYSPDLTYYIHLYADADNGYDAGLLWGYVDYRFADEVHLTAGLFSLPATRASFLDETGYQFVDYTMVDSVFGLGDGVGLMLWGSLLDQKLEYYLALANEMAGPSGPVITTDEDRALDNNPIITFRTVWHALGEDPTGGLAEGDLEHVEQPVLDFAFHYAFNENDGDIDTVYVPYPRPDTYLPGGFGEADATGLQLHQFGLDAQFKWRGFSIVGAYTLRLLDVRWGGWPQVAPLFSATGDGSTNAQHGGYVQTGYFLPIPGLENKLEAVARVGGVSAASGGQEGMWEYAGGMNYYIDGHNVKLQTDVTKITEAPVADSYSSLANLNDDALIWRVQLQVAF